MNRLSAVIMASMCVTLLGTTLFWNGQFHVMKEKQWRTSIELSLVTMANTELRRQTEHCIRRPSVQFGGQI